MLPGDPQVNDSREQGATFAKGTYRIASSLGGLSTGIDTVYHLAAIILSHDPSAFGRVNLEGTANMVAAARERIGASFHLRLFGVGDLPAPHPLR